MVQMLFCKLRPVNVLKQVGRYVLGMFDVILKYCLIPDATMITTAPTDVLYNPKEPANFTCVAPTDTATTLTYSWLFNGQPVYTGDIVTNTNILNLDLPSLKDNGRITLGRGLAMQQTLAAGMLLPQNYICL